MAKRLSKTLWYGTGLDTYGKPLLPPVATNESDLNGLHRGELFMHLDKKEVTLWALSSNNEVVQIAGKQGEIDIDLSDYLLKSTWDKVWELRKDNNGFEYIYSKLPVVTQYGITMYGDNDQLNISDIYEGLPIDNVTLYWENGILKAKVGEVGGGEADSVAWANVYGKPSWITDTKPTYNYSEINGIPDLSVFVTGTSLSKTLADYATLTYLTGELKKYVTLDGAQDIKGVKNFVNGLKIGGMPITKMQDDVIYIDANLVVRGGVTMYSDNEVDIPSIKDEIGFAGYNGSVGLASFDSSQFVISANGTVSVKGGSTGLDTVQLKDYLDSNKYTTETWVKAQGYASASSLSSLQTKVNNFLEGSDTDTIINKWKELETFLSGLSESDNLATILGTKANQSALDATNVILATKWTTDNNLINQWNTAYGWGDHSKVGYALKSYVDSNFVTLGTKQTITGEKNFTGELKVNGSPIYYDATNKYWKLEGDLLVTGGVSMYSDDSEFTPSTIMDGVVVDGTSIRKNPTTGALEVIGGSGSTTKYPLSWSGFNQGSYDGSVAQSFYIPTKLSEFVNDKSFATTSDLSGYLPISGGTVNGTISLGDSSNHRYYEYLVYRDGSKSFYAMNGNTTVLGNNTNSIIRYVQIGNVGLRFHEDGNSYDIYHSGNFNPSNYLPLSGGTLNSGTDTPLNIEGKDSSYIGFKSKTDEYLGWLGVSYKKQPCFYGDKLYEIWHSGNDGAGSGLDADTLDGYHVSSLLIFSNIINDYVAARFPSETLQRVAAEKYIEFWGSNGWFNSQWGKVKARYGFEGSLSGNASSATKLETPRTIWGQSFDGSANVSGDFFMDNSKAIYQKDTSNKDIRTLYTDGSNNLLLGYGHAQKGYNVYINGSNVIFRYGSATTEGMRITSNGNVLIGTTTDSGYKLDVNGNTQIIGNCSIHKSDNYVALELYGINGGCRLYSAYQKDEYMRIDTTDSNGGHVSQVLQIDKNDYVSVQKLNVGAGLNTDNRKAEYRLGVYGTLGVTGVSTFRNDVSIATKLTLAGIPIYKSQNDVLYIDGNLVVRGGVTMYATDAIDVPSIIDALLPASYNEKGIAAFNPNDFSVVDGYVSFIGKGGVDESVLADYAKKTDLSNYLPLSGGTVVGKIHLVNNGQDILTIGDGIGTMIFQNTGTSDADFSSIYTNGRGQLIFSDDSMNSLKFKQHGVSGYHTILHSGNWSQYVSISEGISLDKVDNIRHKSGLYYLSMGIDSTGLNYFVNVGARDNFSANSLINLWSSERVRFLNGYGAEVAYIDSSGCLSSKKITGVSNTGTHVLTNSTSRYVLEISATSADSSVISFYGTENNEGAHLGYNRADGFYIFNYQAYRSNSNGCTGFGVNNNARFFVGRTGNSNYENFAMRIDENSNMLVAGSITMYSDQRKKTILNHVELTLQQIADAPLIEHYYNSDQNKTTHVGSIAQYWAGLNDWFCKLDNEGYYTMEIQNCALASAISIARHLEKYESKTDKKIRMLKNRVKELEDKLERLEGGNYGCN